MATTHRTQIRQFVWEEMYKLEEIGLGYREVVSKLRDKFMLSIEHSNADKLSKNPKSNGFIRADDDSLLLRYASDELMSAIPEDIRYLGKSIDKGLEFSWKNLNDNRVRSLFNCVKLIAEANLHA